MKTFSPGLSDSIASVIDNPRPCPHCDSASDIAGGLCVGCLLEAGLDPADEGGSETLIDLLAKLHLPEQNWRLGNYEILEELGRGGMGVIYRARQRHSRRIVAVKRVLSYHADSRETLARFRREAQAAASLDHPNILPIYEVSESEDGLPFFSMKFAPGGTLQQVAPALRNDPRHCVALVAKVARAVQYAHSRGILHRDLKPGNILLDGHGEPLVSDFGLAKWLDTASDLTRTLTIFGTPGYIAPEQASQSAAELKPTADVYSLGAILFDLLAGRPPFLGSHALSVIRQASESPAPKLRTLSKLADRDLETICSRCLERDPTARYHSAHDLAEDLERWLEGRPIIARPVAPATKIFRWSRRNPKLALAIATVAILSGLGLFGAITTNRLAAIVKRAEMARRSVVVIPFDDLEEVSTTSYRAQSVTKDFVKLLSDTKAVQVSFASREEAHDFDPTQPDDWKRIGKHWDVRMVLSGSVRQREGGQRVTLRAIETATGSTVKTWFCEIEDSGSLSGPVGDLVQLLGSSNTEQTTSLGGTTKPEARALYEKGKDLFFRYNLADQYRAIEAFRKATTIDPSYALAQAMLASACQLRSVTDSDARWLEEAEKAATEALHIAPTLPEAHRANGGNLRYRGKLRDSIDSYLTAYELDPSNARAAATLGDIFGECGRPDIAILWFERATARDVRPIYADNIGDAWVELGDYDKAEDAYRTAAVFRPDLPVGSLGLARLALLRGDYAVARAECDKARAQYKDNPQPLIMAALIEFFDRRYRVANDLYRVASERDREGGIDFPGSVRFSSAIGFVERLAGAGDGEQRLREALAVDQKELALTPQNPRRLYSLAANLSAIGDSVSALSTLESAVVAGWLDYRSLELDPRFDPLRDDEHFRRLCLFLRQKVDEMRHRLTQRSLLSTHNTNPNIR
jgi:serine/threonine protein kinase/Tfp pilus assembly protein PilF